jgi:type IV pilus assembly protein PilN
MPSINLRPWREELRAEKQRNFITSLIAILIVSVALVFLWQDFVSSQIETQTSRNNYLSSSMAELDKKIKEIKKLKQEKKELLDRMKVIQDLQGTRPVIVRVMDELVRTLPDGLYYESFDRVGDNIAITGLAESNNRISGLMRNFESSVWFANPNLKDVSAIKISDDDITMNSFDLSIKQITPDLNEDKESSDKGTK